MNYSGLVLNRIRGWKRRHGVALERRRVLLDELEFLYHLAVASEQLLLEAHNATLSIDDETPFTHEELGRYYFDHFQEEKGELQILVEDLETASIEAKTLTPDPVAVALIGSQYYLIKHVHPVSLLGYMAIMEADPTPIELVEKLESLHGPELLRSIRLHAERDPEHAIVLLDMIDEVPEKLRIHVQFSIDNTLSIYGQR